jgi:hypothetical protein
LGDKVDFILRGYKILWNGLYTRSHLRPVINIKKYFAGKPSGKLKLVI